MTSTTPTVISKLCIKTINIKLSTATSSKESSEIMQMKKVMGSMMEKMSAMVASLSKKAQVLEQHLSVARS